MSTGHIKLWWSVKKQPDSFNIYHSLSPFSPTNLPVPVATGLAATTREFRHLDQEHQYDHYYRIASVKNGRLYVSRGVLVRKKPALPVNPYVRIIFRSEYIGSNPYDNTYTSVNAQRSEGYDYFKVNGVDIKDSISGSIADNSGVTIIASSDGSVTYSTTSTSPVDVELKFSNAIDPSLYINILEGIATIGSDRTMNFVLRADT